MVPTPIARRRRENDPDAHLVPLMDALPRLRISRSTVNRLLRSGEFPLDIIYIGRRRFVRSVDLDRLVGRSH
jgi:Helix-turn-helix domain